MDADAAVFAGVVSAVTVPPVVGVGALVESSVAGGAGGAGVAAVTVVRSAAEAVGCLAVRAVDTTAVDVVMAADGVAVVAVVLVDGTTDSAVTLGVSGKGVRILGGEVAPGTLDVIIEVVEVAVGGVALVVDTCWVVAS